MVRRTKTLSALVERQLPEFISSEYPLFVKFVQKYYEQLENIGQPLDIISNLTHYADIDNYENKILKESTVLSSSVSNSSTTITVEDTSSFPKENGYILIDDEAIFYESKTSTTFVNCYRNVNATTKLGDLYYKSDIKVVDYKDVGEGVSHNSGTIVLNISNLFLYAFVKNFESQYLTGFPEESLKSSVDKKTLIKNIKNFYKAKGTEQSIQFIFNSIVAQDAKDVPTVYYPRDKTLKPSSGTWIDKYALKVKVISGDVTKLIGQKIYQEEGTNYSFAFVDNVFDLGTKEGENIYEIILSEESVVGEFTVAAKTVLTKNILSSTSTGNKINVYSTAGWNQTYGEILIGSEIIKFNGKSVNQFNIESRQSSTAYPVNTSVFSTNYVIGEYTENGVVSQVKMIPFGILYDLQISDAKPYSSEGDIIQIEDSGFISNDPKVFDKNTGVSRWKINETNISPSLPQQTQVQALLNETFANVSAVFEDEQYYYITSSSFPDYEIGPFTSKTNPQDQKHLKLIKKYAVSTTEINLTNENDVGILVNGVPLYGYKDEEIVTYGEVVSVKVTNQGTGYKSAPYVVFESSNSVTATGRAILTGQVVERIEIINPGTVYEKNPEITITSGRNAVVNAVVTSGRVTSLVITNPGEYYSSAPLIRISDLAGRGRYAEYTAIVSADGKLTGFNKVDEGRLYTQENIQVEVIEQGGGATAICQVREWRKNRFKKLENSLDSNFGYYFDNRDISFGYGYGQIANPRKLRIQLSDNLTSTGSIPATKVHSKIIGFAYDGNPIYGPWAYSDPSNPASSIAKMTSSYSLKTSRLNGPSTNQYPLGSFIQDYQYNHRSGTLDENNGRFCVTPEYPEGTYAYFTTVADGSNSTTEGVPVFPYIIGENFYSIPVDSNYNKKISQNDIPKNITRWRTQNTKNNGVDAYAVIDTVKSGGIDEVVVESSPDTFANNNIVYFENQNNLEIQPKASVSSLKGKNVISLESKLAKIIKLTTNSDCYLYNGSTITQVTSGAQGTVVGDVFDARTIVIKTTSGTFNSSNLLNSSIEVNNLILDAPSNFTKDSTVILTNGNLAPIQKITSNYLEVTTNPYNNGDKIAFNNSYGSIQANTIYYVRDRENFKFKVSATQNGAAISLTDTNTPGIISFSQLGRGEVISTTSFSNTVKVKVLNGSFSPVSGFYLSSNSLEDSVGSDVIQKNDLSKNILISTLNDKVALVRTSENHKLSLNDLVNVTIDPNDTTATTTYYVRKRIYQDFTLKVPNFNSFINDNGLGSGRIVNSGADYANNGGNTYSDVELIFADQTKCRDAQGNIVGASSSKAAIGNPGGASPNPNNARATITVVAGKVSTVTITYKGNGYKRGDVLTVSNSSLQRLSSSTSTKYFLFEVIHVGFASGETVLELSNIDTLSNNDTLLIGEEVVKISSINSSASTVTVLRAQSNTTAINHYNNQEVTLYDKKYNIAVGYAINGATVLSYDSTTQKVSVAYTLGNTLENIDSFNSSSVLIDQSTPSKTAIIEQFNLPEYKFEFSKNQTTWEKNPIIDIQKYYKYKFDTSHSSLLGNYFEISPSGNLNIIPSELQKSSALPGNSNSFVTIKIGYGYQKTIGTLTDRKNINYSNFYYYDKSGVIKSDKSYLRTIEDPLQGEQTVSYITPTYFLYDLSSYGQYDGTGTIKYTTTSKTSSGEINSIKVIDKGSNYTKIPIVYGIEIDSAKQAKVSVVWNSANKNIESIIIDNAGLDYVKPKLIIDGDGIGAEFNISTNSDGSINGVIVLSKGKNYTFKPSAKIVESELTSYCTSSIIGVPKTVRLSYNGSNFDNNKTTLRKCKSSTFLKLSGYSDESFVGGEEVVQYDGSTLIAKGIVAQNGWKKGFNILKLSTVLFGSFKENLTIKGNIKNQTSTVKQVFATSFYPSIKSYYDNLGYFSSNTGKIGESEHRLLDSYFYQDFSYVIKSKTPTDAWRKLIKNTIHPAGFKLFGEVSVESEATSTFTTAPSTSTISIVQLWDSRKNKITVENTVFNSVNTEIVDINLAVNKGQGSVIVPSFSNNEITAYEVVLQQSFNGYFDQSGNREGTTSFTMKIKGSNSNLTVDNIYNLIITLDGVLQEPGVSFTIADSTITFAEAPLGYRDSKGNSVSLTNYKEGVDTPPQIFVGRFLKFKNSSENQTYFKKIKDISFNTNNRFLDASNLINLNKDFIVSESVGYLKSKVSGFINEEYYTQLITDFTNAIYHDIRFGGNSDVIEISKKLSGLSESSKVRNFEQIANISGQNFKSITTNGSIVVAVTEQGRIYTSTNTSSPFTWTQRTYTNPVTKLNRILFLNNTFIIVGKGIILSSTNGTSWTVVSRHNDDLYSASYSDTEGYIAVGQDRIYYTSLDGVSWESNEIYEIDPYADGYPVLNDDGTVTTIDLNEIVLFNDDFIVGASSGIFYKTQDFSSWTTIETSFFYGDIVDIVINANALIAVTKSGYSLKSTNGGNNWYAYKITSEEDIDYTVSGVTYVGNEYIVTCSSSSSLNTNTFASITGDLWYKIEDFIVSPVVSETLNLPNYINGNLYVGSSGGKIYKAKNSNLSGSISTNTLDILKYSRNLMMSAIRNWDVVIEFAKTVNGSSVVTIGNTTNIIVGMRVVGKGIPTATFVKEIINDTQFRLGNQTRTTNKNATFTSSNTNTTLLYFSLNSLGNDPGHTRDTGVFLDAARQIEVNRQFIQQEAYGWALANYPSLATTPGIDITKCQRDIGYILDAYVYDLRFGGNTKILEAAESYYIGNTLSFINNQKTESIETFRKTTELAKLAMRNWGGSNYVREFTLAGNFSNENIVGVASNASIRVAITESGKIYTSPVTAGASWTQRSYSGGIKEFTGIRYLNDNFWILSRGAILYSVNGTSWFTTTLNGNDFVRSLAFTQNSGYIAVCDNRVYHTSTTGDTWFDYQIYEGNPLDEDYPYLTEDGEYLITNLNDVLYPSFNSNLCLIAGDNGRFYTSTNLVDWEIIKTSEFYGDIVSVTEVAGVLIAVTSSGYSLRSINATTWTKYDITSESQRDYKLFGHVWVENEYIAVGTYSTQFQTSIFGSVNGQTWYPLTLTDFTISPTLTEGFNKPYYSNNLLSIGTSTGKIYRGRIPLYEKQYASSNYIRNLNIRLDSNTGTELACAGISTALDTYFNIFESVINNGPGKITPSLEYSNPTGAFTTLSPYPNYNITQDYTYPECNDVASSIFTLYSIISEGYSSVTLPSYFDGKNTKFKLYYEDGTNVNLTSYENLVVGLDGVLQRAGITPLIPKNRAYYINRTVVPNEIVFIEPPKSFDSENYQKFFAYSIGKYDLLTIIPKEEKTIGPFNIIFSLTDRTAIISDDRYVLVFVDGILQRRNESYIIRNSLIYFTEPLEPTAKVYMMYWYGLDFVKNLFLYGQQKPQAIYQPTEFDSTPLNAKYDVFLGDLIRVQGEREFRKVLSDPYNFEKTEYRAQDQENVTYSAEVKVTNYNEDAFGNGLDVQANILNGKVVSLTWNKKDYTKQYPQPNNYGYEESPYLTFVSQPEYDSTGAIIAEPQGGGAKAYAVLAGGEVIDIVLVDGGSGYVIPPKIFVTKKFDVYKSNTRKAPTEIYLNYQFGPIQTDGLVTSSICNLILATVQTNPQITSLPLISPAIPVKENFEVTILVNPESQIISDITSHPESEIMIEIISDGGGEFEFIHDTYIETVNVISTLADDENAPIVTIASIIQEIVCSQESGIVEYITPFSDSYYLMGQYGSTFASYDGFQQYDFGFASVSDAEQTIENFTLYHPTVILGDFSDRTYTFIDGTGKYLNAVTPSITEYGAILDIGISATDTIVYIPNTFRFPEAGIILIGDELVKYTSKLSDRFLNCTRGYYNTIAKTHDAGDYLRTVRVSFQIPVFQEANTTQYPTLIDTREDLPDMFRTYSSDVITRTGTFSLI